MKKQALILLLSIFLHPIHLKADHPSYVSAHLCGGLGNHLFQVATACALAWDHQAIPIFPGLKVGSEKYQHVFFRLTDTQTHRLPFKWHEPSYSYQSIPFKPNLAIRGYFQSEKYFSHWRPRLLQLLSPRSDDLEYIETKYQNILLHPNTVGIQIRYYRWEVSLAQGCPQYDRDYIERAIMLFPQDTLFVVSSNHLEFARQCIPSWVKDVIFLEGEPDYIDLHVLSRCKHNIITNSTFGWWCAWLNQNPNKRIIRPDPWMLKLPCQDVCPERWVSLKATYK